jgi:hypothetical protein
LCGVYERTRTFEASPFIARMIAFPDSISSSPGPLADPSSGVALDAAQSFVERLADLPALAWLEVGRALLRDRSSNTPRVTACAMLAATIKGRGLAVAAWYACDAIETSAFYASRAKRWTPSERRALAAAHAAAEDAALALLARQFVPAADCATLVAPFEPLAREALSSGLVSVTARHRHGGDDHQ